MSKTVLIATVKPFSGPARQEVEALLEQASYRVEVLEAYPDQAALVAAVGRADALIVRSDRIDAEVLAAANKLKLVVRAGAGYDTIDCQAARARDVAVMNTPGQNANAVAELALGLMVYLARGQFGGKPGRELRGKRLGIHAYGAVGRAVHAIAKGFGMQVSAFDTYVPAADIAAAGASPVDSAAQLYQSCDYVSLHLPANDETRESIGKALLSRLPEGGTLINTARAEVICEPELCALLAERTDLRYATDVAPSAETKALLLERFASRVYVTPKKMGAQTAEANRNAGTAAARQIIGFFERGDLGHVVNG